MAFHAVGKGIFTLKKQYVGRESGIGEALGAAEPGAVAGLRFSPEPNRGALDATFDGRYRVAMMEESLKSDVVAKYVENAEIRFRDDDGAEWALAYKCGTWKNREVRKCAYLTDYGYDHDERKIIRRAMKAWIAEHPEDERRVRLMMNPDDFATSDEVEDEFAYVLRDEPGFAPA